MIEPEQEMCENRAVYPSVKYEKPPTWAQRIRGFIYISIILVCPFLDMILVFVPMFFLVRPFLNKSQYRRFNSYIEKCFYTMISGLLELYGGMQVILTTEPNQKDFTFKDEDQILLIANHRSEVDWLFFWNLAMRFGAQDRIRVMMKSIIRYIPGPGWSMLLLNYPYIDRNWATDKQKLRKQIKSYTEVKQGSWFCMFPEGTALFKNTLASSQHFAKEKNLPIWQYVLHPRVKGFDLCVKEQNPDYILDVTIGYPELQNGVRPSPLRFLKGQFPTAVHIHVKHYTRKQLEGHSKSMEEWCKQRFAEKEKLLEEFYMEGKFEGKRIMFEKVDISKDLFIGCVFHLFMVAVTGYMLWNYPWYMITWIAGCCTYAIYRTVTY